MAVKKLTVEEVVNKTAPNLSPKDKKKQAEAITAMIRKGVPLKKSLGLSNEMLEFIYSEGRRHYMIRKYPEALKHFYLLYFMDPADPRFSFGIASIYHMQKNYDLANIWYLVATQIDTASPLPYYHMSDVALQQGKKRDAVFHLKKTIQKCGSNKAFEHLVIRSKKMIEGLEKDLKK